MGTLFNQKERPGFNDPINLTHAISNLKNLSKEHSISLKETIDIANYVELRRQNDLKWYDGDVKDEQLTGFGELLEDLTRTLFEYFNKDE